MNPEINQLNLYVKKNRDFVRYFYRGATQVEMDSAERILITKPLLEYAKIEKEVVLFAYKNVVEIWDKGRYDVLIQDEPIYFADLAEEILGKTNFPLGYHNGDD